MIIFNFHFVLRNSSNDCRLINAHVLGYPPLGSRRRRYGGGDGL